jgi:hypothetical protein
MMNQILIRQQLQDWLLDFVEKPNPLLNGWAPCPYARKSRIDGKFNVKFCTAQTLVETIKSAASELGQYDVVAVCIDPAEISAVDLELAVSAQNQQLMPADVLLLEDHPSAPEVLNGVNMNFGPCAIVFVQQLSKINEASDQLRRNGYYDHWPQENLDDVVTWRVNSKNDLLPN